MYVFGVRGICKLIIMLKSLKRRGRRLRSMAIAYLVRSRYMKRWRWGLRKRISTVLSSWRYIIRIISVVSVIGRSSV